MEVIGTTIAIVQLTGWCLERLGKEIGPSQQDDGNVKAIRSRLEGLNNVMSQVELYVNSHKLRSQNRDNTIPDSMMYIEETGQHCKAALEVIKVHLDQKQWKKLLTGIRFDKRLQAALNSLDEARKVFMLVLSIDTQGTSRALKEVLDHHSNETRESLANLQMAMHSQSKTLARVNSHAMSERSRDQHDRVRSWFLSHDDASVQTHERNRSMAHNGSCAWLHQCDSFQQWVNSPDASPVIWIAGEHGIGKSILCAKTIDYVQDLGRCAAFHYCRYNNQLDSVQIARSLILQLFEHVYESNSAIASLIHERYAKIGLGSLFSLGVLIEVMILILGELKLEHNEQQDRLPAAYVFLDGIDEASPENDVIEDLVKPLLRISPQGAVHIWVSSRRENTVLEHLQQYPTLNPRDYNQQDVRDYLENVVQTCFEQTGISSGSNGATCSENDDSSEESLSGSEAEAQAVDHSAILTLLLQKAEGNFFYASLLRSLLRKSTIWLSEIDRKIDSWFVSGAKDFYMQFFSNYDDPRAASRLFSLVTFSKRPLRLHELRDAMAVKITRQGRESWEKPLRLERMFYPLIIELNNPANPTDPFCQLTHSAVRDFLLHHPHVLGSEYPIDEKYIADICLNYLQRRHFSQPFGDTEALRKGLQKHHFLTYAAKYWDKHLDAIGGSDEHYEAICRLLESRNFQTLLQVQSISVAHHFSFFPRGEVRYFRKSLPSWFEGHNPKSSESPRLVQDYRRFQSEWAYFLDTWCCNDWECSKRLRRGNIKLASSGLLGPSPLFKAMEEQHCSFLLHEGSLHDMASGQFEGVWMNGSTIATVEPIRGQDECVHVSLTFWSQRPGHSPTLKCKKRLPVQRDECEWHLYSTTLHDRRRQLAQPCRIAFSNDLGLLRVGSRLYRVNQDMEMEEVKGLQTLASDVPRYFQEFAGQGSIVVLCRRQVIAPEDLASRPLSRVDPQLFSEDAEELEADTGHSEEESAEEEPTEESGDRFSSEPETSAYETCSEGSTELGSEANLSIEKSSAQITSDSSSNSPDREDLSEPSSSFSEDNIVRYDPDDTAGHAAFVIDLDSAVRVLGRRGQYISDSTASSSIISSSSGSSLVSLPGANLLPPDSDDGDDPDEPFLPPGLRRMPMRGIKRPRRNEGQQRCSIIVVDTNQNLEQPRELFHFDYSLSAMLYDSPPALHPTKSLLVWPLCQGQILFADYENRTYYLRQVAPTTSGGRFVSIKVHFSSCGKFLHMACLEAKTMKGKAAASWEKDNSSEMPKRVRYVNLSVLVTTYRLSAGKTTRSPPTLLHKVKVDVGDFLYFSISPLAITFTWSPEYLFIARSSYELSVVRVSLFKPPQAAPSSLDDKSASTNELSIMQPKLVIPLPASAQQRQVYYVPPSASEASEGRGLVMMGPYATKGAQGKDSPMFIPLHPNHIWRRTALVPLYSTPPSGLYVSEEEDQGFGGWTPVKRKPGRRKERHGNGELVRKIEPFDPVGDCELEDIAIENIGIQ